MNRSQFIIIVDTAQHLNMLTRLASIISRRRIMLEAIQSNMYFTGSTQRFIITITETRDNARNLSKQIEKQVDVVSVNLFEQTI